MDRVKAPVAVVIIPTYNEAGNIGRMIDYLNARIFSRITDWRMHIVVVDSNSADGTGIVVTEKAVAFPHVHLVAETERNGIGAAYLAGFKYAIEQLHADAVFEFDADFQHPPELIPIMLAKMDEGYDYVLGSRKMRGGGETAARSLFRSALTAWGGFAARFILFFPGPYFRLVTDPTTGLKLTRVKGCLDRIPLDQSRLYSRQFGYRFQLLSEIVRAGARYAEIPLQFQDRFSGASKFRPYTIVETLAVCLRTRWHDSQTQAFLKFACIGFVGYLINAVSLQLLSARMDNEVLAWAFSTELAMISNFTFNNIWTFKRGRIRGMRNMAVKFAHYNGTTLGALLVQTLVGTAGVMLFGARYRQWLLIAVIMFFTVPYNWLMYNKVIWRIDH